MYLVIIIIINFTEDFNRSFVALRLIWNLRNWNWNLQNWNWNWNLSWVVELELKIAELELNWKNGIDPNPVYGICGHNMVVSELWPPGKYISVSSNWENFCFHISSSKQNILCWSLEKWYNVPYLFWENFHLIWPYLSEYLLTFHHSIL